MNDRITTDSRQLLRLRSLREDSARAALARCRDASGQADAAVARREADVAAIRTDRTALLTWMNGSGACVLPRLAGTAAARLAALDDTLERAEVALADERLAAAAAARAVAEALAAWQRASARRQAVAELADSALHRLVRTRDERAERECDHILSAAA